jgi:hypothetical protein
MNLTRLTTIALAVLLLPAVAHSKSVTIPAAKDNTIFENAPNNSAGGAAGIFAGTNNAPSKRRGLLAFDIAANVPPGATITGAQLRMHLGLSPNTNNQTIGLHRLMADWGEGTVGSGTPTVGGFGNGAPAAAGDATWSARMFGSSPWTNAGATGDFIALASTSAVVGGSPDSPHTWLSNAALISDVQSWLDSPATNFGWALVNANETSAQTFKAFYSQSATLNSQNNSLDPSFRPALTIHYVPEPTVITLLTIALPLVLARRRR